MFPTLDLRVASSELALMDTQRSGRIQKTDPPQGSVIYSIGVLESELGVPSWILCPADLLPPSVQELLELRVSALRRVWDLGFLSVHAWGPQHGPLVWNP